MYNVLDEMNNGGGEIGYARIKIARTMASWEPVGRNLCSKSLAPFLGAVVFFIYFLKKGITTGTSPYFAKTFQGFKSPPSNPQSSIPNPHHSTPSSHTHSHLLANSEQLFYPVNEHHHLHYTFITPSHSIQKPQPES